MRPCDEQWLRWTYCLGKVRASDILCWETETGGWTICQPTQSVTLERGKQSWRQGRIFCLPKNVTNKEMVENKVFCIKFKTSLKYSPVQMGHHCTMQLFLCKMGNWGFKPDFSLQPPFSSTPIISARNIRRSASGQIHF